MFSLKLHSRANQIFRIGQIINANKLFLKQNDFRCYTSQMEEPQWKFYQKNWALNRPKSPWTAYHMHLPMQLSLYHRITGVAIYSGVTLAALGLFLLPNSIPYYIDWLHSLGWHPHVWNSIKFVLVCPVAYHAFNGIRHLNWDVGKGFRIPTVYATGITVLVLTVLTSAFVALKL